MWYNYAPLFPLYDIILVAAVACAVNIWETAKAFPSPPAKKYSATFTINLATGKIVNDGGDNDIDR